MVSASAVMKEGMQERMLLNIIPSMSADPLKGDAQSSKERGPLLEKEKSSLQPSRSSSVALTSGNRKARKDKKQKKH